MLSLHHNTPPPPLRSARAGGYHYTFPVCSVDRFGNVVFASSPLIQHMLRVPLRFPGLHNTERFKNVVFA
jgi:hypothetical protein